MVGGHKADRLVAELGAVIYPAMLLLYSMARRKKHPVCAEPDRIPPSQIVPKLSAGWSEGPRSHAVMLRAGYRKSGSRYMLVNLYASYSRRRGSNLETARLALRGTVPPTFESMQGDTFGADARGTRSMYSRSWTWTATAPLAGSS